MAKSKKALKALRRRKSAKGRSRALKQRQDYTLGGRVKAFTGLEFNESQIADAEKAAENYAAGAGQPPTSNEQPPEQSTEQTFSTERPTDGRFGVGHEGKNLSEADVNHLRNQGVTVQADGSVAATDFKAWADTRGGVRQHPEIQRRMDQFGMTAAQAEAHNATTIKQGADLNNDGYVTSEEFATHQASKASPPAEETPPASTEPPAEETPPTSTEPPAEETPEEMPPLSFEEEKNAYLSNFIGAADWGTKAPNGSYVFDARNEAGRYLVKMPDSTFTQAFTLEEAQRLSGASSPYLGTPPEEEEAPEETPEEDEKEDITKAPAVDYEEFIASRMELRGQTREEAIAHLNNALNQTENFADYNKDGVIENAEWAEWKKLADTDKDGKVTPEENAAAVRQMKGQRPDPSDPDSSVGDPAQGVLDEIYDETSRDRYRVDDPEAFETAKTPTAFTQLTDRTLDTPTDISQRTATYTDAPLTTGTAVDADAQEDITATQMEAYSQAAANYYDKYPWAKKAVDQGQYPDFIAYHAAVGRSRGYTIGFDDTKIAQSDFERIAEAERAGLTSTDAAIRSKDQEEEAKTGQLVFTEDLRSQVDPITGKTILLSATPDAEKQQRQAITDETAAVGTEALIQGSAGYDAAERREIKGEAASGAARSLLQEVGELPEDITEVIIDNPTQIIAQIDTQPVEVQAALAALPPEALMSAQLEALLAGIDEGTTPTWARPAVQLVESRLNARGLSVSTVGRDALFNAIIQTALPIAQNNAAALQQRANQNLSNEQQANLQQSSQEMQLRLTNVANRQSAETQSAQLAQQIKLTQGEIKQQTALTESQERQQVRLQSLQNEQQAAMANLGNDQQIELANLQVEAERLGANQNAANQEKLAEMQVSANFMQKNQEFVQQMELANLSNEQQMRLSFLTAKNQAESENLTANQQTELANLNKRLEVNKISANLAQQMGLAQLNVDQQSAMQNAATVANIDLTKFSSTQQIELANSKFMQTATLQDLNNRQQTVMQDATTLASMDLQAADSLTKVSIENARNFLQKDLTNLSVTQQAFMLDSQQSQQRMLTAAASENASRQFNATSQNQTDQFMASLGQQLNLQNAAQENAMEQFNTAEANRLAALNAGNTLDAAKFSNQINTQIDQFNTQIDFQRDQWNKQNAQAVEQSNVNWRRQTNMAETAAQNAANQLQAQQLFTLDQQEQAFLWQQLRDEATYYRTQYESEQQRKTTLYATALANESKYAVGNVSSTFAKISNLFKDLASPSQALNDRFATTDYLGGTGTPS